jgi:hypothetical protein
MIEKRTRQDFLAFLDWMSAKGLMAKNTASARKAAANKVLGILNDDEANDVTKLDLADVMRRFTNLQGRGYTPGSLGAYFSRLKAGLDDFEQYLDNPMSFRPGIQTRERRPDTRKDQARTTQAIRPEASPAPAPQTNALSIPLRPDKTIVVQGLPYDLSEAEAAKIANVIRAMVTPATEIPRDTT